MKHGEREFFSVNECVENRMFFRENEFFFFEFLDRHLGVIGLVARLTNRIERNTLILELEESFFLEVRSKMGGAMHRATRVFRMYNIENRVDRVLAKEKPKPSPRFPTDQQQIRSNDTENTYFKWNFFSLSFLFQRTSLRKPFIGRMINY